jgi:hypothetical protein
MMSFQSLKHQEALDYVDAQLSYTGLQKHFGICKPRLILAVCLFKLGFWIAGLSSVVNLE